MIAERLAAQLLSGAPARSPEEAVDRLLSVQAQDGRGARLAVRARTVGLRAADVDEALTDRRSLVVSWLNRGTLHLVRSEDYWWLHDLTTPPLATGNARRLGQLGVSESEAGRAADVIMEEVASRGPRTRAELRAALDAAGLPTAGQALVHLLFTASLRHHVVRGPVRDGEHCFVDAATWLGRRPPALDEDDGLARLARRYLLGHGPAGAPDLAKWAGVPLRASRRALAVIEAEVAERGGGLVDLVQRTPAAPELPPPRLLGAFDPLLHGWANRDFVVGRHRGIVTTNGLFRPFALVAGRAVATWTLEGRRLTIRALEWIGRGDLAALEADAAAVRRFLGLPDGPVLVEH